MKPLRRSASCSVHACCCLAIVATTIAATVASAETKSWPHIRGVDYTAHTTWSDLHLPWPKDGPIMMWRRALGQGYSGLIAVDGRIYTQMQTRQGQFLVCISLRTGVGIWRRRYAWPWEPDEKWPGPYASPTYADGRVFFAGGYGLVGCADAISGRLLWQVHLTRDLNADIPGFGYACTPLVQSGVVYVQTSDTNQSVVALNAQDGSVVWRAKGDEASYVPCTMITVSGRPQLVSALQNSTVAHNPKTGQEIWRWPWSAGYDPQTSWPLYEEPYLLRSGAFRVGARALRLSGETTGVQTQHVWQTKTMSMDIFSGVVSDSFVYGFDVKDMQSRDYGGTHGTFRCIELATGSERWATDKTGHAGVLVCGDKLILMNDGGVLIVAELTPEKYRELARTPILPGSVCWTTPALYDGYLLVRGGKEIACVYLGNPSSFPEGLVQGVKSARLRGTAASWLDEFHDETFLAPGWRDLARWFAFCVAVFIAAGFSACLSDSGPERRELLFWGVGVVLGAICMPLLTTSVGKLVFTWPVVLYLLFQWVVTTAVRARRASAGRPALRVRATLLVFVLICLWYYSLCRRMFLPAGQGFLIGFLPAVPTAWWAAKLTVTASDARAYGVTITSFSIYFWFSAITYALLLG